MTTIKKFETKISGENMKKNLLFIIILMFFALFIINLYSFQKESKFVIINLEGYYSDFIEQMPMFVDSPVDNSIFHLTQKINKIIHNESVDGIIVKIKNPVINFAKAYDIIDLMKLAQKNGKKIYVFANQLTLINYLIASAGDVIMMPHSGNLQILGISSEVIFLKDVLNVLGINPDFINIGDYKTGNEIYTRSSSSEFLKQEIENMMEVYFEEIINIIAQNRKISKQEVKSTLNKGFLTVKEGLKNKFIDLFSYETDLLRNIERMEKSKITIDKKYTGDNRDTQVDFSNIFSMMQLFSSQNQTEKNTEAKIGLIFIQGNISLGKGGGGLFSSNVGSDSIIKAIDEALDDETVKAVVLRVDSPGGSALASDIVWDKINKAKRIKPIIVSMSDVAASGGYYVSMGADYIFAEPVSVTGSIGVLGGKFNLKGLYDKIGLKKEYFSKGKLANMFTDYSNFSEYEKETLIASMEEIYNIFVRKASMSRKIDLEEMQELAQGRIWLGIQAVKNGLIDELGGLNDALKFAGAKASLKEPLNIQIFPKRPPFIDLLQNLLFSSEAMNITNIKIIDKTINKINSLVEIFKRESTVLYLPFYIKLR